MIRLRRLTEDDVESVAELYRIFWNEHQDINKMKMKLRELSKDDRYIFLCATVDDKVAGTIMGVICEEIYGNCRPFLVMEDLIVHNKYRRMGIGSLLLNELENLGKQIKCSQIIFITDSDRKDAISFYESHGFNPETHKGFKKKL